MEVSVTKIDGANAQIDAEILATEVEAKVQKIAKQLAKTANVQGFRKGKVPVAIIKKMYGQKLVEDAENELLREAMQEGLAKLEIEESQLLGEPSVVKFEKQEGGDIKTSIKIATRPDIDLGEYKELIEEFEKPKVSDEEVDETIAQLAKQSAELKELPKNRVAKEGHIVEIDFEGFLDGEPFEGGKAEHYDLELGSNSFIPGFEEQLLGMKKGEEKKIRVTFPKDYGAKNLAGKEAEFAIKLHAIKERGEPKIDDELAKKLLPSEKEPTLQKLKERIQKEKEQEKLAELYSKKRPELIEKLVKSISFDLPEFIVEQEIDLEVNKAAKDLNPEEIKALQEDASKLKEFREQFREEAKKSVKATFIIDALAKAEGIEVNEDELIRTIYLEAIQAGEDPQKLYEQYRDAGYLPAIQMAILEDKVLSALLDAKMKEG